ncbi:MAG: BMC domain-containing protein [Acidobacteriota bacterium]|nr:BMC domain-containing protein [Acidobacteriota bacterium]MDH3523467.1 BMC domain-containing protein [Acidobacteriota bacterium]
MARTPRAGTPRARETRRHAALALLEFETLACGILAGDRMVKRAPIALLRCGTVHPGRFLVLVGGSVASTEEAFRAGVEVGETERALRDCVLLSDVHPALHDAVLGTRRELVGEALAVIETTASPALLAAVDAAVKGTPVGIGEVRLADDLGGRALALLSGSLTDAAAAVEICVERAGNQLLRTALLPRLDGSLRLLLDATTRFAASPHLEPAGAEYPEEATCSWDG